MNLSLSNAVSQFCRKQKAVSETGYGLKYGNVSERAQSGSGGRNQEGRVDFGRLLSAKEAQDAYNPRKTGKTGSLSGTEKAKGTQGAEKADISKADAYREYLKEKFGCVLAVKNVGKDQKSFDALGAGTAGTGNVVIAPNILEKMTNDSEKAAYYEEKIQHYFDSLPRYQAELSAMGHEIHSSGIVIHEDGTVTHYICGDLKPEVRARIEARVKAEQEEKAKRRKMYLELGKEAAERRRQMTEAYYREQEAEGRNFIK